MPDRPDDAVVLELELIPHGMPRREPTTLRVTADGRFAIRSDSETTVGPGGEVTTRPTPLEWRPQWTFTPDQMAALRDAIARANDPPLAPRYAGDGVDDGGTAVWRMRDGDRVVDVVVEGHPGTRVPALDALQRRLFELRPTPARTSVWRVRADGESVERRVNCDAAAVPVLRPLLAAVFGPAPPGRDPPAEPPDAEPLLEIAWLTDGVPSERTIVDARGRRGRWQDDAVTPLPALAPEQLTALREAIERAGWPALPDPLCDAPTRGTPDD